MTLLRLGLVTVLLLGVYLTPWWIPVVLGLLGLIIFSYFIEAVLAALLLEIVHGSAVSAWLVPWPVPWLTLGALGLFLIIEIAKDRFPAR